MQQLGRTWIPLLGSGRKSAFASAECSTGSSSGALASARSASCAARPQCRSHPCVRARIIRIRHERVQPAPARERIAADANPERRREARRARPQGACFLILRPDYAPVVDSGVVVALIASLSSLGVAFFSVWMQQRGTREAREHARMSEAKVVLDRYRGPLLAAAWELGDRIDNIRHDRFLDYLDEDSELAVQAELTTLYRFAQYFGWREVLRTEVQLLSFDDESDTRLVASLIGDIVSALATDRLDGRRAMLWAEQQRAIGELMIIDAGAGPAKCIGYAAFFSTYDDRFKAWMGEFAGSLKPRVTPKSERLRLVEWGLVGLVRQLDEEGTRAPRGWTERAWREFRGSTVGTSAIPVEHRIRQSLAEVDDGP
jgi:hypothetical protein